ncbi:hypothetical protein JKP88DRAFT_251193 [Tribonema minus]|uniref:Uncharacterized protein n=1 Tax=Tribonema minus TaxID=303371 RepID=A0A835ZJL8_9STRA|nr:hypothetical protein JKP88DRAFT_251193 [Tribonema minus]
MRRGFLNSKKGAAKGGGGGGSGGAGAKGQVTPLSSPTRSGSDGSSGDVRTDGTLPSPEPEANAAPQQPPAAASPQAVSGSNVAQAAAPSPTTAPESNAAPAFVAPTMVSFVVPATAEAAAEPPAVFRIGVQTEDADGNPIPPRTIVRGAQRYRAAAAAGAAARAAAPVDIPFGAPAAPDIDAATFEFGAPVAGDGAAAAAAPDAVAVVAQRACGGSAAQAPSTPPQQAQGLKRKSAATGATGAANGVHDMYVVLPAWSRDTVVSRQRMERKVQRYHTDLLPSAQEALMQVCR